MAIKNVVLSSGQVNRYGYRILPEGIKLDNYKHNPVLLYTHRNQILSVGKVINIRVEDGQLKGDLEFDMEDTLAKEINRKFEKGYMNAVSIWHDPITVSDDPKYLLQGQTRSTVVETDLLEVSVVNVPGDAGAHALSADRKEVIIPKLSINKKNEEMELTKDELALRKTLGLSADATAEEVTAKITQLQADADNALSVKVDALMTTGKSKGFITDENADKYKKLAMADYDTVKGLIDDFEKSEGGDNDQLSVKELLAANAKLNKKDGDEGGDDKETFDWLQKNDPKKLLEIKRNDPEKYNKLAAEYNPKRK